MVPRSICSSACLLVLGMVHAGETGFISKQYQNADGHVSHYVLWVPPSFDGKTPLPVILFLHGAGETLGGKKQPKDVGIGPYLPLPRNNPVQAIVVIPQSEKRTWKADSEDGQRAMAILDTVMNEYNTDPTRVYLTGLSMGGYGTWSLAAAHPNRWAAIVPICGGGDPKDAEKIKHIPCWAWHGDQDKAVSVEKSREMIAALKAVGGNPKYTELAGVGHLSWDAAYATNDLYVWLFAQKKK